MMNVGDSVNLEEILWNLGGNLVEILAKSCGKLLEIFERSA